MTWIKARWKVVAAVVGGALAVLLPTLDQNSTPAKIIAFVLIALTGVGVNYAKYRPAAAKK